MSRRHRLMAAFLIGLGLAIRLYSASTAPLDDDEINVIRLAQEVSLSPQNLRVPIHGDQHPAGALYLVKLGTLALGWTPLGVRLFHVLLNAATLPLIYGFARAYLGSREALWALALVSLNPFHIGFGRTVTPEQYLFFQIATMALFWKAVVSGRGLFMVGAGVTLEMALFLKETPLLLIPIFIGYLWGTGRLTHWARRRSVWVALGAAFLFVLPDLWFNLTNVRPTTDGFVNYRHWLSALQPVGWSIRPLSMYLPILFFKIQNVESVAAENYVFMDNVSGAIILLGVGYALTFHRREPVVAFLLSIFLAVFCFFSFFINPTRAEFWWASPTFFPGVLCGGILLARLTRGSRLRWPFAGALGLWLFLCALSSATQPTLAFTGHYMVPIQQLLSQIKQSAVNLIAERAIGPP